MQQELRDLLESSSILLIPNILLILYYWVGVSAIRRLGPACHRIGALRQWRLLCNDAGRSRNPTPPRRPPMPIERLFCSGPEVAARLRASGGRRVPIRFLAAANLGPAA